MSSAVPWPAVTVVVTCFNLETYVGEALQSVRAQDYPGAVELIVVDDASTDDSVTVIEGAGQLTLVRLATNGGVLQAMLAGFARATHDLIFLLDGDDIWEASKLRLSVEAFQRSSDVGFTTHSLTYVDGNGRAIDRVNRVEFGMARAADNDISSHLRRSILAMRDDVWLGSAMGLRRSKVDLDGFVAFASTLLDPRNCYQDWPLAYWIASQPTVGLAYVPERLFRYRIHGSNHSGDAGSASRAARNFRRAANTLNTMVTIGERFGIETGLLDLRERAASYDYLANLYLCPGWSSIGEFLRSAPSFKRRRLVLKEMIRLVAILAMGPDRFASWAAQRGTAKDVRTS